MMARKGTGNGGEEGERRNQYGLYKGDREGCTSALDVVFIPWV
jgi:hypothetical protein